MVEVGSISIGGSIQTAEIDRGLKRVETGFKDVERVGKSVNADFTRMNQQAGRLAKTFGVMALAGGGAMVAIAKGSPALAGSMAKLKVAFGKLSRTLGEALRPAIDLAVEAFQKFVGWVQENKGAITFFTTTVLGGMLDALKGIKKAWDWLNTNVKDLTAKIGIEFSLGDIAKLVLKHAGPEVFAGIVGAMIGAQIGGPMGAAVGGLGAAGATYAGRRITDPSLYIQEAQMGGFGFGQLFGIGPFSWNPFKKVNMKQAVLGEDDRA